MIKDVVDLAGDELLTADALSTACDSIFAQADELLGKWCSDTVTRIYFVAFNFQHSTFKFWLTMHLRIVVILLC